MRRNLFRFFLNGQYDEEEEEIDTGEGSVIVHKENIPTPQQQRRQLKERITYTTGTAPNTGAKKSAPLSSFSSCSMPGHLQQRELCGSVHRRQNSWISQSLLPKNSGRVVVSKNTQIFSGIFSPDGSEFIAGCQDRCIRIFDANTWKLKERVPAIEFGWSILDIDCTDDSVIYCTWSSNICMHKRGEQQQLLSLSNSDNFGVFSVKFSPDEKFILAGGSSETVFVFDLENNTLATEINAHSHHVNAVKWLGNSGNIMLSGSDDGMIKLWDCRDLRGHMPQSIFVGHLDGISYLDSMESGDYFLSNSKDQSVKVWDIRVATSPTSAIPPPESYWDYRYGEESLRRNERELRSGKFAHRDDNSVQTYRGHSVYHTLIRARFSPARTTGERYIYTGSAHAPFSVHIYDVASGELIKKLKGHDGVVRDVSWNPNFPRIVSTGWDGNLIQWDV